MRPIDADELVKELTRLKHDKEYSDMDEGFDNGIDECIDEIKDTPMIDAVPTTHAYWKDGGRIWEDSEYHLDFFDCSACGWKNPYADTSYFKFCPNCGARMIEKNGSR